MGVNEALGIRADRAMAELVRVASVGPLVWKQVQDNIEAEQMT